MNNRLLSNILFVVRAIDGARGPVDLGFARTVSRHPVDVGFETTETKCRREAETLELRAPDGAKEAIDGRKTSSGRLLCADRSEAETRSRSAGEWLLFAPTTKKDILSDILFRC